jgi:hypothetical protein
MGEGTFFAPAGRESFEKILNEKELLGAQKILTELFGTLTGICAIINKERQIVFANDEFLGLIGLNSIEAVLGKRPGEVISCINSFTAPSGCGTAKECRYCGAVAAIMDSIINDKRSSRETRITSEIDGRIVSWDLNVTCAPVRLNGEKLFALSLQDISMEKKLRAIEKIFFHDLLNTAGGLNGLLTVLKMGTDPDEMKELIYQSEAASQVILEEIMSYRQLRAAEDGDIKVQLEEINTLEFLRSAISKISFHEVGQDKSVVISNDSVECTIQTDRLLLQRVLINLLKNALEATSVNGTVTVSVLSDNDKIIFKVHNKGIIPEEVRYQIFQRSFSTKDRNRGLGTYSVRLMTENYLKGKVSFISNEADGTVFSVEINRRWQLLP